MSASGLFDSDSAEPLALLRSLPHEPAAGDGTRRLRFEYASRGDRVPGHLFLPAARREPHPLVLTPFGVHAAADADVARADCARWIRSGVAVASVDLPLSGQRASAKLGARVLGIPQNGGPRDTFEAALWTDYVCQAVVDLRRAVAALTCFADVDAQRIVFGGFGLAADIGIPFCAEEPRIRAAAFVGARTGMATLPVDPLGHVGRLSPRPCLFVNAARDARLPRSRAEALHAAACEPKRVAWLEETGSAFLEAAYERMHSFLAEFLDSA